MLPGAGCSSLRPLSRRKDSASSPVSLRDARRLAKIFNTESCWLVSIDGSEDAKTRWQMLEEVLGSKRSRNDRLPIFLFGDELTAEMVPANVLKHANAFMRLFEDSPEFLARSSCARRSSTSIASRRRCSRR